MSCYVSVWLYDCSEKPKRKLKVKEVQDFRGTKDTFPELPQFPQISCRKVR